MKRSVFGLLDRGNLLDLLRNFIVFDVEEGHPVKKVARYQQFAAANEIVRRALDLDREQEWRRGLIWHTQGSGKSLTILFAAKKLWHHPKLQQPTILIVIDRDQLQDQMMGQFIRTNTENCKVAQSKAELVNLLSDGDGYRGIIVTIMHKFSSHETFRGAANECDCAHRRGASLAGRRLWELDARDSAGRLAVWFYWDADREQRSQHSAWLSVESLGRTIPARNGLSAICSRVAGIPSPTPFATERPFQSNSNPESATGLFGARIWTKPSKRSLPTFPRASGKPSKLENAKLEVILKLPKRIKMIAEDLAADFKERVRPNRFKAMLVCYDKETCALYKAALDELLGTEVSLCIYSEDPDRDQRRSKETLSRRCKPEEGY